MTTTVKKLWLPMLVAVLMASVMVPAIAFAGNGDADGGEGSEPSVHAVLDFGTKHEAFARRCAGDEYAVSGSEVSIPISSQLQNKAEVAVFLEGIMCGVNNMNISHAIDEDERIRNTVGLNSSYSSSSEFTSERNGLRARSISDGDKYYVQWDQQISKVKGTLKAPLCGTQVVAIQNGSDFVSNPAPEITFEGNVTATDGTPLPRWARFGHDSWNSYEFEGPITDNAEFGFEYVVKPTFGYYFTDGVTHELEGGFVGRLIKVADGQGLHVKGEVYVEHYAADSASTTSITKATPAADGEYSGVCVGCGDSIVKTIPKPSGYSLPEGEYTYDGTAHEPAVTVTDANGNIIDDENYYVSYTGNVNAGNATATVNFKGSYYEGWKELPFKVNAAKIIPKVILSTASYAYNGTARKPEVTVINGKTILDEGQDYTVSYPPGCKNAGNYKVTVKMTGNYSGTASNTFTITKAVNPLKTSPKTASVKYSKLKKKARKLAVNKVIKFTKDAKDGKTYTLSSAKKGGKSVKKYFKINKSTGTVTVKKGLAKGTYKVGVKVKAAGNSNYEASGWNAVAFKVKVK